MSQAGNFVWIPAIAEKIRDKHRVESEEIEEALSLRCLHQETGWTCVDSFGARYDCYRTPQVWEKVKHAMDKLPRFQALDELVAFWDDHDFTDYMDEMKEAAEEGMPGQRQPTLQIALDRPVWERFNGLADRRGTSSDRLARQRLEERVAHEMA